MNEVWKLFFATDQLGTTSPRLVAKICDKAVSELKEYCDKKDDTRFTSLLLRLSPLRSLQPDVLEELFFAGLIGNVQIDSVVPYILKMESSEYQSSKKESAGKKTFTSFFKVLLSKMLLFYVSSQWQQRIEISSSAKHFCKRRHCCRGLVLRIKSQFC